MKTLYCLGFAFNLERTHVLLIRKNRPRWMAGRLNGIGGKIEEGETPAQAMVRECLEEAGLAITEWDAFGVMEGEDFEVTCFKAATDTIFDAKSMTDEIVSVFPLDFDMFDNEGNPNVSSLIARAVGRSLV